MRTTVALDDELVAQAQALTGINEKSRLLLEAM
jgi:Arc/MetJ family transcription regulator